MATTAVRELRTDFTSDTKDLERGAHRAAGAYEDVTEATKDLSRAAEFTDDDLDAMADSLKSAAKQADRAEEKLRELRREVKRLSGQDVDIDVDVDEEHIGRFRRLRDVLGGAGGLGEVLKTMPPQAKMGLAALAAALVGTTLPLVTFLGIAAGSGAVIGGLIWWLSKRPEGKPIADGLEEIKKKLKDVADVFAKLFGPTIVGIFKILKDQFLPLLDKLMRWLKDNQNEIKYWLVQLAKWTTDGIALAANLGIAFLKMARAVFPFLLDGIANLSHAFGVFLAALGRIPGFGWARDASRDMGNMATNLHSAADGIRVASDAGVAGLRNIRSAAQTANDELDDMTVTRTLHVNVEQVRKARDEAARMFAGRYGGGSGKSAPSSRAAGAPAPVYQMTVNVQGGDPRRVVDALERFARVNGRGATIAAPA